MVLFLAGFILRVTWYVEQAPGKILRWPASFDTSNEASHRSTVLI